jgi:hypothetical protein
MYKLKDGIKEKELEKFGFRYDKDDLRYFRKYDNGQLIIDNRCIFDAFIDAKWVLYDTFKEFLIEDLIKADLVEKV